MPLYEYQCDKCKYRFEVLVRGGDSKKPACPHCGLRKVTKQISSFAARDMGSSCSTCSSGTCSPCGE